MTTKIPRILITNDDGIESEGLKLLNGIAKSISNDVWVIAPDKERSGASHSVSITAPIRTKKISEKQYSTSGSPVDCVILGVWEIMKNNPPDVILSGINNGANLADDLAYSGTFAAAMEGALLGFRSIALSQVRQLDKKANFEPSEEYGQKIIKKLLSIKSWPNNSFFNVNFPSPDNGDLKGHKFTQQGKRPPGSFSVDRRIDPRNNEYFWIKLSYPPSDPKLETDLKCIDDNYISITPVTSDFTSYTWKRAIKEFKS